MSFEEDQIRNIARAIYEAVAWKQAARFNSYTLDPFRYLSRDEQKPYLEAAEDVLKRTYPRINFWTVQERVLKRIG